MEEHTKTDLSALSTEELFDLFKHDGSLDFNKKLAAGRVLHQRKFNIKELSREKGITVESIKKDIADYDDKASLNSKLSVQNKKSIKATTAGSLIPIIIFIYLYIQLEDKNSNDAFFIIGGAIFLSFITIYNLINYRNKQKKRGSEAKEDNELRKQKLKLITKEWTF